jgi:transcription elongation factor Elf1
MTIRTKNGFFNIKITCPSCREEITELEKRYEKTTRNKKTIYIIPHEKVFKTLSLRTNDIERYNPTLFTPKENNDSVELPLEKKEKILQYICPKCGFTVRSLDYLNWTAIPVALKNENETEDENIIITTEKALTDNEKRIHLHNLFLCPLCNTEQFINEEDQASEYIKCGNCGHLHVNNLAKTKPLRLSNDFFDDN